MAFPTLARKVFKVMFYILLSLAVGRTLSHPEAWFNRSLAIRIGQIVNGTGEVGADNLYEIYFYISLITIFSMTTLIYVMAMKLIKKISAK